MQFHTGWGMLRVEGMGWIKFQRPELPFPAPASPRERPGGQTAPVGCTAQTRVSPCRDPSVPVPAGAPGPAKPPVPRGPRPAPRSPFVPKIASGGQRAPGIPTSHPCHEAGAVLAAHCAGMGTSSSGNKQEAPHGNRGAGTKSYVVTRLWNSS